jgi:hypothetical protein
MADDDDVTCDAATGVTWENSEGGDRRPLTGSSHSKATMGTALSTQGIQAKATGGGEEAENGDNDDDDDTCCSGDSGEVNAHSDSVSGEAQSDSKH